MMNYKKIITATPAELAKILHYYSVKGGLCVACDWDCVYNRALCTKELHSWLMGAEDKAFWEGFEQWKKQHNL